MSAAPTSGWSTAGTGSCHSCGSAGTIEPRPRTYGPMSRWVSLYQARAKASASWSGFSRKRREMASYAGSMRMAMSAVVIMGACDFEASWASGTVPSPAPSLGVHCCAPAGLLVSSHS